MAINTLKKINKYKEYIFGYSSLLGLIISFFFFCHTFYKNQWDISSKFAIVLLAFINCCLAMSAIYLMSIFHSLTKEPNNLKLEISNLIREKNNISEDLNNSNIKQVIISKTIHDILHKSRNLVNRLHSEQENIFRGIILFLKKETEEINYDSTKFDYLHKSFEKYMIYLLDILKTLFDVTTSDICRVCIKMVLEGEEAKEQVITDNSRKDVYIGTYLRDSSSLRESEITDDKISSFFYNENWAFQKILEPRFDDSWYLNNDLSGDPAYKNYRANWKSDYNATLVVPIRIKTEPNCYSVIGFICVDNKKGNFKKDIEKDILASIGDHLYHIFRSFSDLKEAIKLYYQLNSRNNLTNS